MNWWTQARTFWGIPILFFPEKWTSRFLVNEIMIFWYFSIKSIGFGRFGGIRFVT